MPRLIHLNGPSRVGKSTLARRYANEHPGTLVLDLDVLAGLIGGWKEDFSAALEVARGHGRELDLRHLHCGCDVILPQLVTVHDRDPDPAFEEAACAADATYVEVALMVEDQEHLQRLQGKRPSTEVEERVQAVLEDPKSDLVHRIRRHLNDYLAKRPHTIGHRHAPRAHPLQGADTGSAGDVPASVGIPAVKRRLASSRRSP